MRNTTPMIPWLLVLASCSSPPKPPTVDESQKRPVNSQMAVELQVCRNDLQNTRLLATESSRIAERVRIARELHDLVGHHLTALTLNLEVASHLVEGNAKDKVRQAQSVAKLLLSDVREVVSQLRQDDAIDLTKALHSLVEGVPQLAIHLELPPRFGVAGHAWRRSEDLGLHLPMGSGLLGRVVDAFGHPLDRGGPLTDVHREPMARFGSGLKPLLGISQLL